jgi:hypothetical protein
MAEVYASVDRETAAWTQFVQLWWDQFHTTVVKTMQLINIALDVEGFPMTSNENYHAQLVSLGTALAQRRERIFGNFKILQVGENQGALQWRLKSHPAS